MLSIAACSALLVGLVIGVVRPLDVLASGLLAAGAAIGAVLAAVLAGLGRVHGGSPRQAAPSAWQAAPCAWQAAPSAWQAVPSAGQAAPSAARALGLLALVALGAWWASLRLVAPPDPLADLAAQRARVSLEGSVASPPTHVGATAHLTVLADTLSVIASTRATRGGSDGPPGEAPARLNPPGGEPERLKPPPRVEVVDWWDGPVSQLAVGERVHLGAGQLARRQGEAQGQGRAQDELLFPTAVTRLAAATSLDPRATAASVRGRALAALQAGLPEPEGTLAAGLLLGSTTPQDPQFRQQLQRSGLGHLLAVDGYKQVLVAGALQAVAMRLLGRWRAVPLVLLGIGGYTLLTGASPSAVRAGLMLGLSLVASLVGRVHDPLLGLLLAASSMAAVEPGLLRELAFQLSFAATLGLVLFYPRVRYLLRRLPRPIAEPFGLSLAVSVATLPVTLVVFQQVSVVSPLAHVVAVPLVPVVLAAAVLLLAVQPIPGLASPVAALVWLPTHLLAQVIALFGSLPGAAVSTGHLPPLAAAGLAVMLIAWGAWQLPDALDLRRRVRRALASSESYQSVKTPLAVMLAGALSSGLLLLVRPDGHLHVRRLAVRRGTAVLVRAPGGESALIVKGAVDPGELADDVRQALPVWERSLDLALVVDPADAPRLGQTLRFYPAKAVADAGQDARLDLGRGAVLDVYGPPVAEVRVSYANRSLSLTDASGEAGPLLEPDEDEQV